MADNCSQRLLLYLLPRVYDELTQNRTETIFTEFGKPAPENVPSIRNNYEKCLYKNILKKFSIALATQRGREYSFGPLYEHVSICYVLHSKPNLCTLWCTPRFLVHRLGFDHDNLE